MGLRHIISTHLILRKTSSQPRGRCRTWQSTHIFIVKPSRILYCNSQIYRTFQNLNHFKVASKSLVVSILIPPHHSRSPINSTPQLHPMLVIPLGPLRPLMEHFRITGQNCRLRPPIPILIKTLPVMRAAFRPWMREVVWSISVGCYEFEAGPLK